MNGQPDGRHRVANVRDLAMRVGQRVSAELDIATQSFQSSRAAHQLENDQYLLSKLDHSWNTIDAFLCHLADRAPGTFFLNESTDEAAFRNHFLAHYPGEAATIVRQANRVCRNEFRLLNHRVSYPGAIDWNTDPVTGQTWPLLQLHRLDRWLWASSMPADLKYVWELNRHQFLVSLGLAFRLTADDRYALKFNEIIDDWIRANPLQRGINWYSSLEVAIRVLSWLMAFQLFRGAAPFRRHAGAAFLKSLYSQVAYLDSHLTDDWAVPNNHLIGESAVLTLAGVLLSDFSEAETWRARGLRILTDQVARQTFSDGVNKEQAAGYQGFVIEFLLPVVLAGRRGLLDRVPSLEDALQRMMDYIAAITAPDGTVPLWGDSDDGHAFVICPGRRFSDFRPLIAQGSLLFNRSDWKFVAKTPPVELLLLWGEQGLDQWRSLSGAVPAYRSRAFEEGGIVVLRDGWNEASDFAVFRCGPFGLGELGPCAHAHCDLLSFQLWLRGQPCFIDSGTYTYHEALRDAFRATGAHNTLMIDSFEQARPQGAFVWDPTRIPSAHCCGAAEYFACGEMQVAPGVTHRRTIEQIASGTWEIVDALEGTGSYPVTWYFHIAPGCSVREDAANRALRLSGTVEAFLEAPLEAQVEIREGWYSEAYGEKVTTQLVVGHWQGALSLSPMIFRWKIRICETTGTG